ncbi:MAG: transporter substrate-binding domain-containing protein [Deltaproteobacteria bacterium]|nr:MAG: transporter substrate-binding domain-containing protein [Deltaproteobacteria bacterium]
MPRNHKIALVRALGTVALCILFLLPVNALAQDDRAATDKLLVGAVFAPPASMKSADGKWEGLAIELWRRVAQEMGVQYELREYSSFGEITDAVKKNEVDVITAVAVTKQRELFMDFSNPYLRSGSAIAVAAESTGPSWLRIVEHLVSLDFLKVICVLILLWLTAGAFVWLFERSRNPAMFGGGKVKGIGQGIWWAAVTMTTVGYGDKAPKSLGGRMVALVWMLVSIILIASFTATITTSLTVGQLSGKVRGPRDLPTVRVGSVAESASLSFLSERGIAALPFVHERDGLQAIVENKIDAFVHNELVLKYLLRTEFPARVQVLPETFDHYYVSMGMPSGSPLREPLNRALLEIMSRDDWLRLLESYVGSGH